MKERLVNGNEGSSIQFSHVFMRIANTVSINTSILYKISTGGFFLAS